MTTSASAKAVPRPRRVVGAVCAAAARAAAVVAVVLRIRQPTAQLAAAH